MQSSDLSPIKFLKRQNKLLYVCRFSYNTLYLSTVTYRAGVNKPVS